MWVGDLVERIEDSKIPQDGSAHSRLVRETARDLSPFKIKGVRIVGYEVQIGRKVPDLVVVTNDDQVYLIEVKCTEENHPKANWGSKAQARGTALELREEFGIKATRSLHLVSGKKGRRIFKYDSTEDKFHCHESQIFTKFAKVHSNPLTGYIGSLISRVEYGISGIVASQAHVQGRNVSFVGPNGEEFQIALAFSAEDRVKGMPSLLQITEVTDVGLAKETVAREFDIAYFHCWQRLGVDTTCYSLFHGDESSDLTIREYSPRNKEFKRI